MAAAIEEPSDVQGPDEAPETEPGKDLVERIEAVLALKPTQKKFTDDQKAVMRSMGWPVDDMTPADVLHFQYFCAARNLDPFLREVMPLKTRDGIVPIIRIAGMRKIAEDTGAYEGLTSHFEFQDALGDWHEGWPQVDEKPVACRIGVYKRGWREAVEGSCRTEEAEVREPVEVNGRTEWVLTERWRDRLFTMLKTTAEADGLRRAFPEHLSGVYTPEEMTRVRREREEEYLRKVAAEGRQRRREAMRTARGDTDAEQAEQAEPERVVVEEGVQEGVIVEPERVGDTMTTVRDLIHRAQSHTPEPLPDLPVEDAADTVPVLAPEPAPEQQPEAQPGDLPLSEADRKACLLAELDEQAAILDTTPEFLAQRFAGLADGEPLPAWSSDLLLRVATAWRKGVAAKLRKAGRYEEAAAYTEWGPKDVDRVEVLFGRGR